jgi:hypothetical protein
MIGQRVQPFVAQSQKKMAAVRLDSGLSCYLGDAA